ncbi:hypothetical protein L1887_42801 [Cichorium endivia]|nr:hypothetical protein L1887_42801 [Cichorium endivia]
MALRDLIHDRKVALCIIFSLIAVIAPLLLLFGLKNGIVSQLRHQLLDDPRTREVRITGNGNYDLAWLDKLARRSEVGFSIPLTRSLNTQADLVRDGQHFVPGAEVIPTAKGDPLLQDVRAPVKDSDTVLSASAARRLGVQPGDILRLMVSRKSEGKNQRTTFALTVTGVLDDAKFSRQGCIASLVGAFIANIDRKRKDMAVLRLLGFRRRAVTLFIIIQALCLTGVSYGLGVIIYLLGSALFNHVLGSSLPDQAFVCHLDPLHFIAALLCVLAVALGVAAIGALRALKIEPAESLREI